MHAVVGCGGALHHLTFLDSSRLQINASCRKGREPSNLEGR